MQTHDSVLSYTLKMLCEKPKGIFAADESIASMEKKFAPLEIHNTSENRLAYRDMLLNNASLSKYISGVILFDETLRQSIHGEKISHILLGAGILIGIKVDLGLLSFNELGEEVTQGLDTLRERCLEYYELGARFAKWRAVYKITDNTPTEELILRNANDLAMYAKICQECGLVPMVEPELLATGDHGIDVCYEQTARIFSAVFEALKKHHVDLSRMILKPNMIVPGLENSIEVSHEEIATKTLKCLGEYVSAEVPAIMFLSGGQSDKDATQNLNLIAQKNNLSARISFSYGRALQDEALSVWNGKAENREKAQAVVLYHAKRNADASVGKLSD